MDRKVGCLLVLAVLLLILWGLTLRGMEPERDLTGFPLGDRLDCSIRFVDPENPDLAMKIGIFNLTDGVTSRCGTLKFRCEIQQGVREPVWGEYAMVRYSFRCEWDEGDSSCTCWP